MRMLLNQAQITSPLQSGPMEGEAQTSGRLPVSDTVLSMGTTALQMERLDAALNKFRSTVQTRHDMEPARSTVENSSHDLLGTATQREALDVALAQFRDSVLARGQDCSELPADGGDVDAEPTAIAIRGASGARTAIPHVKRVQAAFGRHDISAVAAHVATPEAIAATTALNADAYAIDCVRPRKGHFVATHKAVDSCSYRRSRNGESSFLRTQTMH